METFFKSSYDSDEQPCNHQQLFRWSDFWEHHSSEKELADML